MLKLQGDGWVITDAAAGNQRQALALAEHLGLPSRHLLLEPRAPWSWLAPRLTVGGQFALPPSQRAWFAPPWPAVAIGCGRAAALFTRMLRSLSAGRCYTVQILDPRIDPAQWDTVVAPRHDGLEGANVLQTLGSLNAIDEAWLADGREACPHFGELPRPRVGVLLGGPRRGIPLDADYINELASRLLERQRREPSTSRLPPSRRWSRSCGPCSEISPDCSGPAATTVATRILACSAGPTAWWSPPIRSTCSAKPVRSAVRCRRW